MIWLRKAGEAETHLGVGQEPIPGRIGSGFICRCGRTVCSEVLGGAGTEGVFAVVQKSALKFCPAACGGVWRIAPINATARLGNAVRI